MLLQTTEEAHCFKFLIHILFPSRSNHLTDRLCTDANLFHFSFDLLVAFVIVDIFIFGLFSGCFFRLSFLFS